MHPDAAALIERLQLRPHPEGGFYRELYRSASLVQPADGRLARAALTTIYFLLPEGTHSRWHRVASDEVWHLYEGGPLELFQTGPEVAAVEPILLGPAASSDPRGDDRSGAGASRLEPDRASPNRPVLAGPVHVVPANCWQAARARGPYALVGCTVGPGFDFADFSFLRDFPDSLDRLRRLDPALAALA